MEQEQEQECQEVEQAEEDFQMSESTRQVMLEMLRPYDHNGDNVLDLCELGPVLAIMGCCVTSDEELEFLRKKLDKNGDGKLTFDELFDNAATINAHSLKGDDLRKSFEWIDKSRNGYITREELRLILMAPGPHKMCEKDAREEVDRLETMFDKNKDGRLDYNEFVQMWTSMNPVSAQCDANTRGKPL